MVALWGIESNFGERQGSYSVFGALATLAYEGRRAAFFRRELLSALQIADKGYADAGEMRGSWAGAMGQNQFMPSTYLGYAVDFDGDGHRDIWHSLPDVFASMANYLDKSGWDARFLWGREVAAPAEHRREPHSGSSTAPRWPPGSSAACACPTAAGLPGRGPEGLAAAHGRRCRARATSPTAISAP